MSGWLSSARSGFTSGSYALVYGYVFGSDSSAKYLSALSCSDGKLHMTKKKQFKLKKKARIEKMGTGNAFHGKGKKGRHGK